MILNSWVRLYILDGYFNRGHIPEKIPEFKNRAWFILALSRLAMLSGKNPFIFEGTPKKSVLCLTILLWSMPEPTDEVEQHITINAEDEYGFRVYIWTRV